MMVQKRLFLIAILGLLITAAFIHKNESVPSGVDEIVYNESLVQIEPTSGEEITTKFAGQFLASHFAQSENDWETANKYLEDVLEETPTNYDLQKKAMILSIGSGHIKKAVKHAKNLLDMDESSNFAAMLLFVDALSEGDIGQAKAFLKKMPKSDVTGFLIPLLQGWINTNKKSFKAQDFETTLMHSYHGALIALYRGKKKQALALTNKMAETSNPTAEDMMRVADLFILLDHQKQALEIYEELFREGANGIKFEKTLEALQDNDIKRLDKIMAPFRVKTPAQGVSLVMYDMAQLLYKEHSDKSAQLFAQMALVLNPDFIETHLLLADIFTRNHRYEDAIDYFSRVPADYQSYLEIQRHIAELLIETGKKDKAMKLLNKLFVNYGDVDSLIQIGDLYRDDENFSKALKAYNRAAKHIGGNTIPEKYWYLLYARGMAYERQGQWKKAEADLNTALTYRPNHPYILNYLGYGWADQGLNLEKSTELIKRALALRPSDGYITDSLGWVLYMSKNFEDSILYLERAVELLPYDATINDHLGDAYWQTNRRLEARFQWQRASNYAEDEDIKKAIDQKLYDGLPLETAPEQP